MLGSCRRTGLPGWFSSMIAIPHVTWAKAWQAVEVGLSPSIWPHEVGLCRGTGLTTSVPLLRRAFGWGSREGRLVGCVGCYQYLFHICILMWLRSMMRGGSLDLDPPTPTWFRTHPTPEVTEKYDVRRITWFRTPPPPPPPHPIFLGALVLPMQHCLSWGCSSSFLSKTVSSMLA